MDIKDTKGILAILIAVLLFFQTSSVRSPAQFDNNDKLLFVTVSTDWCFACKIVKPVIEELQILYQDKVNFVRLNLTSEDTVKEAESLAVQYGIGDFFNKNRSVIPTIGILCLGEHDAKKVLIGARSIDVYKEAIEDLLHNSSSICTVNGRPPHVGNDDGRPQEPQVSDISGGRPIQPEYLERPRDATGPGRPEELELWTYGEPMSPAVYYRLANLNLPECTDASQVLCIRSSGKKKPTGSSQAFDPWTPFATRDKKGFEGGTVKIKNE